MNTKIQNATIAALKNKASIKFIDCDKNTQKHSKTLKIIIILSFFSGLEINCFSEISVVFRFQSAWLLIIRPI